MGFITTFIPLAVATASAVNGAMLAAPPNAEVVKDNYIVVMKDDVSVKDFDTHQKWVKQTHRRRLLRRGGSFAGAKHTYTFDTGMKGYAGSFDEETIKEISERADVKYVEPDTIVKTSKITTQKDAPSWGLGRTSSKEAGAKDYYYDDTAGEGVTAYIVDTGIELDHPEFEGRAKWGTNTADSQDEDCNGHGTHVSGTVAGKTYGISKKANLVAAKVLDCQGSGQNSGVIKGMEWAMNDAKENGDPKKSVMNMSLGGSQSQSTNDAAAEVVKSGIFLAVAAGNESEDAKNSSPASEPSVCTVGASNNKDSMASFSNFGKLVDVFAPGEDIVSSYLNGGKETLSGTSMASPHVAGLGAYFIGLGKEGGEGLCDYIAKVATDAVDSGKSDTTKKLIYNDSGK